MAKMTLLDMTQSILSAMSSDNVNSIDDTEESIMVALTIKNTYFTIINDRDWPFLKSLTTLTALGDTSNPTKMRIPEGLNKIEWIKYRKKDIDYLAPKDFKDMIDNRTEQAGVINSNGYIVNADPTYWTSYDDDYIYFDGYDSDVESSLQQSNTAVYGLVVPSWTHTDSFIPTLPEKFFPTLLSEAKAQCFVDIKEQTNAREERKARRGIVRMQNESWRNENGEVKSNTNVNYGRK